MVVVEEQPREEWRENREQHTMLEWNEMEEKRNKLRGLNDDGVWDEGRLEMEK